MHVAPRSLRLALLVFVLPSVALAAGHDPAVRGLQRDTTALLAEARTRSATVRSLIDALDGTDVVVYIDFRPYLDSPTARTTFLTAAGGHRYLLVSINPRNDTDTRIALLGHELQHAIEIASAVEVRSAEGLRAFYAQRPNHGKDPAHFETFEARHAEEMVRSDLHSTRAGG